MTFCQKDNLSVLESILRTSINFRFSRNFAMKNVFRNQNNDFAIIVLHSGNIIDQMISYLGMPTSCRGPLSLSLESFHKNISCGENIMHFQEVIKMEQSAFRGIFLSQKC